MIETWEVRDWAAVLALVLSVMNTVWQIVTAFGGRKRLSVTVVVTSVGERQDDGSILNSFFPNVTVRAITGPVGIDSVRLTWSDKHFRADLHTGPPDWPSLGRRMGERLDWDPMNMHCVLDTGERADWTFRVSSTQVQNGILGLVAVVTRTNGRETRSAPFVIPAVPFRV